MANARLALVSDAIGEKTAGLVRVVGKSRVLRMAVRWSDEVLALLGWLAALLGAFASLAARRTAGIALRVMRRALRPGLGPAIGDRRPPADSGGGRAGPIFTPRPPRG